MNNFDGIDIVTDNKLSENQITQGLSEATKIEKKRFHIINDIADYPKTGDQDIVCIATNITGEFSFHLSIQCAPIAIAQDSKMQLVLSLSALWNSTILFDDGTIDPFTMHCARHGVSLTKVSLDPEALDANRYEIKHEYPETR